jgi:hypothetical protein
VAVGTFERRRDATGPGSKGDQMGCSCGGHDDERAQARVDELLESVGMREVVDQGQTAMAEAGSALEHLNRSERARALGFGFEVASVHADAAARANQRAQEQAGTVVARIDHVLQGDDWAGHVERVQAAFRKQGGARKLADLREDVRLHLLDADEHVSASTAELALACVDSAVKAAAEGDLNQIAAHMRAVMQSAQRGLAEPEMGRQPLGDGLFDHLKGDGEPPPVGGGDTTGWCVALAACLAWAYSSLVVGLILCFAIPFCWCCIHLLILATFGVHQIACVAAFAFRCQNG